jgi:hypothetical protein
MGEGKVGIVHVVGYEVWVKMGGLCVEGRSMRLEDGAAIRRR